MTMIFSHPMFYLLSKMMDIDNCLRDSRFFQFICHMLDKRSACYRHEGLWQSVRQRFQTSSKTRCKYHRLHNLNINFS